MLKKPLLKSFLIKALIINIIVFFFGITLNAVHPAVVFGGSNYLVVWQNFRIGNNWDIYGARVDQSGNVLDTAGITISTAPGSKYSPSVAFDGTNYLVVWGDYRNGYSDIYGTRVDQLGNVIDTNGIAISTAADDQRMPSIAFDGTNYQVVWEDNRSGSYDIYVTRMDQSGIVLDTSGIPVSTAANYQWVTSIAFGNINYLVVWIDYRNSVGLENPDIYGTRVDQSGNVLDTAGIAISTDTNRQIWHSISFDGTNYLVVWEDYRNVYPDIYGTRVDQSGNVLDTANIRISTAVDSQCSPAVAFDGTNYLVAWQDQRSGGHWDVYCARVDQSGIVIDTSGIFISTTAGINEEDDIIPDNFYLSQNYPNPFISRTKVSFTLPKTSRVSLKVYDISGRLVTTIIDDFQNAGVHEITFDGYKITSGIYFYHLKAGEFTETKKMILVR